MFSSDFTNCLADCSGPLKHNLAVCGDAPLAFNHVNRLVIAACDSRVVRLGWTEENVRLDVDECKIVVTPPIVGERAEPSFITERIYSCQAETPVGGTVPITVTDFNLFPNDLNQTVAKFYNKLLENSSGYRMGYVSCDETKFFGFWPFSWSGGLTSDPDGRNPTPITGTFTLTDARVPIWENIANLLEIITSAPADRPCGWALNFITANSEYALVSASAATPVPKLDFGTGGLLISQWVNAPAYLGSDGTRTMFMSQINSVGPGRVRGYGIGLVSRGDGTNAVFLEITKNGITRNVVPNNPAYAVPFGATTWAHVAVYIPEDTTAGDITIFVNGVPVPALNTLMYANYVNSGSGPTVSGLTALGILTTDEDSLVLGGSVFYNNGVFQNGFRYFTGNLDETSIFTQYSTPTLVQAAVTAIYQRGATFGPPLLNPVVHYAYNHSQGVSLLDKAASPANGVLQNYSPARTAYLGGAWIAHEPA